MYIHTSIYWCVCVCVCERERERKRGREGGRPECSTLTVKIALADRSARPVVEAFNSHRRAFVSAAPDLAERRYRRSQTPLKNGELQTNTTKSGTFDCQERHI